MVATLKRNAFAASLSFVLLASTAWAGGDHHHEGGPHGGLVQSFGKFHMEAAQLGDKLNIYLLEEDGKTPAKADLGGGTVIILAPGKTQEKIDVPASSGFSETSLPIAAKKNFTALVKLKISGKDTTAKFNFKE